MNITVGKLCLNLLILRSLFSSPSGDTFMLAAQTRMKRQRLREKSPPSHLLLLRGIPSGCMNWNMDNCFRITRLSGDLHGTAQMSLMY